MMEEVIRGKIWKKEKVEIVGGCKPAPLKIAQKVLRTAPDEEVKTFLSNNRHVMCRSHNICLDHAIKSNWDGFVCTECAKSKDPHNRLAPGDILDRQENSLLKLCGFF